VPPETSTASQQVNYRLAGLDKEVRRRLARLGMCFWPAACWGIADVIPSSQLSKYQFANDFESKTKLPKAVSFLGLAAFISLALFLNVLGLAGPLSFVIGSVLPTYTSIQALESAGHEDDTQALFYWVVFTALTAVEYVAIRPILCAFPSFPRPSPQPHSTASR
jgi:hypothetical protein